MANPITPDTYISPLVIGTEFTFVKAQDVYQDVDMASRPAGAQGSIKAVNKYTIRISHNGSTIEESSGSIELTYVNGSLRSTVITGNAGSASTIKLKSGTYTAHYEYSIGTAFARNEDELDNVSLTGTIWKATYTFTVVQNYLPLKQYTITDVIKRLCDIAEPIYIGENPRFRLRGLNADGSIQPDSIADKLDKIIAPQFTFTKQTLRECLQQIGAFIHGEPRLIPVKDESGEWIFEIDFDQYGKSEKSGISTRRSVKSEYKRTLEQYCTHIDSSVENLVNQLDKFSGVISEPSANEYRTVRTESVYARIQDDNIYIPTTYKIYDVEDIEVGLIPNKGGYTAGYVSIKPYLFEKTNYDAYLSSYSGQYPTSKAYGIYFTQGENGIHGLSFKLPDATGNNAFKDYTILNILRRATNNSNLELNPEDYPKLAFRVTYTPFYNSRIAQSKVHYKEAPRSAGLVYNQGANVIETRYYGENMKGVVARLGNVERTETYLVGLLSDIPKAGDMFDKDYYISAVYTEFYPSFIKITVGLSKDFNKLSEYIGINSTKRYAEVSVNQTQERNMLFREYVVIGTPEEQDATFIDNKFVSYMMELFKDYPSDIKPISNVISETKFSDGDSVKVSLPVISSAFGNSICFSWQYEDNYSAGSTTTKITNTDVYGISGVFQNNYEYCDYYGRADGLAFNLGYDNVQDQSTIEKQTQVGGDLPAFNGTEKDGILQTPPGKYFKIRKDSRENLQANVQIDLVSNDNDLIIGSALAAYCSLVRGTEFYTVDWSDKPINAYRPQLYVFDKPLDKFVNHLDSSPSGNSYPASGGIPVTAVIDEETGLYKITAANFPKSGKSWAIVTRQTEEITDVEDEYGNPGKQVTQKGGDVLLAKNMDISAGQAFEPIYFTPKREVFDKSCWKDKI